MMVVEGRGIEPPNIFPEQDTSAKIKQGLEAGSSNPLIFSLVAGEGFEPSTFGL